MIVELVPNNGFSSTEPDQTNKSGYIENCREIARYLLSGSGFFNPTLIREYSSIDERFGAIVDFRSPSDDGPNAIQIIKKSKSSIFKEVDLTLVRLGEEPMILYLAVDLLSNPMAIFLERPEKGNKDLSIRIAKRPLIIISGQVQGFKLRTTSFLDCFTSEALQNITR